LPIEKFSNHFIFVESMFKIINSTIMSFHAYLDNIKAKTGNSAEDFKKLADKKDLLKKEKLGPV